MDRLLDMGFRREIEKIINYLPRPRQTLLFSATVPDDVQAIIRKTMRPGFVTVDCIHDSAEDGQGHTNSQVQQSYVIVPSETRLVSATVQIVMDILKHEQDAKIIAFFPTANLVAFYASLFHDHLGVKVLEIHSRKSQSYREKASEKFRKALSGVLFTSDVSARGVDYPDVTHVIQFGIADSRESYIHRLGRTGRAGKAGLGLLVLADMEEGFLKHLKDLDVHVNAPMQSLLQAPVPQSLASKLDPVLQSIGRDQNGDLSGKAVKAYVSMLGFYNTNLKSRCGVSGTDNLVNFVNNFAYQAGFDELPPIEKKTIGKMGLKGVQGLNIGGRPESTQQGERSFAGRSGGGGRNSGRGGGGGREPSGRGGGRREISGRAGGRGVGDRESHGRMDVGGRQSSGRGGGRESHSRLDTYGRQSTARGGGRGRGVPRSESQGTEYADYKRRSNSLTDEKKVPLSKRPFHGRG
jgi:ATP-dependent RNA helicase MSS116